MLTEVPGTEGQGSRRPLAVAATVGRRQRTVLTVVALASVEPNPEQPRRYFAEDKLTELAASILERGLLQPIVVRRRTEGGYQILAGERRFRAAQLAGLDRLPAVVRDGGDALEIALIENLQREDLAPLEEAEALAALVDRHGYSHREIADLLGKSRPYVSNTLALTRLPEPVKTDLHREGRTFSREVLMGIARQADPEAAVALWNRLKLEAISVRQFREERITPARPRSPVREAVLAARRLNRSLRRLERSQMTSGDVGPLGRVLRRTRRLVEGVTASLEGRSDIARDPVA
jgi:ParB family transcriptional regulator, chromosome partitioning protein